MVAALRTGSAKKPKRKKIFLVTSAKGGTGKTFLTANLGAAVAAQGKKTLLFDFSLASPNLHSLFKKRTLTNDASPAKPVDDLIEALQVEQTDIANLLIIAGNQPASSRNIRKYEKADIVKLLRSYDVEYIFVDTISGWSENITFFAGSEMRFIYIIEPTPFAIESFYFSLKHTLAEKIMNLTKSQDEFLKDSILVHTHQEMKDMYDVLDYLVREKPESVTYVKEFLKKFHPFLILNKSRSLEDRQVASNVCFICKRQFGIGMDFIGLVDFDENIWQANRKRQLVVSELPMSVAAKSINDIALSIIEKESKQ